MDHGACVPIRVHTVVVSLQHSEKIGLEELRKAVMENVIKEVIPARYLDDRTIFHVNPCGLFIIGGPQVKSKFFILNLSEVWFKICNNTSRFPYRVMLALLVVK